MSLSQDPALSALKQYFVCGYKDISKEPYAGLSGSHDVTGNAVRTTNGAGPHNLQLFMLASDGTVLNCLPGYWSPQDLVTEMGFASQLNQVWKDPRLGLDQKKQLFSQMHLEHVSQHSPAMVRRSRMQGFDQQFEAEHRPNSDTIRDKALLASYQPGMKMKVLGSAFKTTDEIFHERMASRPFVPYERFDVAMYSDYGKPKYDKHEDYRDSSGQVVNKDAARNAPLIGNTDLARPMMRRRGMQHQMGQLRRQMARRPWNQTYGNGAGKQWGQTVQAWGQSAKPWGQ